MSDRDPNELLELVEQLRDRLVTAEEGLAELGETVARLEAKVAHLEGPVDEWSKVIPADPPWEIPRRIGG